MHLIDNGTQVASLPAPRTAVGTPGYAFNGDPGTGTPTIFDPDMGNTLIQEVAAVITGMGIALDRANNAQLLAALNRLIGGAVTAITSDTTLTADQAGLVTISAASGNVTVTMPANNAANGKPLTFMFIRTDTSANTVTIARAGSSTFWPGTVTSRTMLPMSRLGLVGSGSGVWYEVTRAAPGMQAFTSSGTFTVPAGVTQVEALVWGGGGGSMASSGGGVYTGGGGGGGYSSEIITGLVPGATVTVTVGAGGTASSSGVAGGTGGTSSFGSYLSATGGAGGATVAGNGASAGTGSSGTINLVGQTGAGSIPSVNAGDGGNAAGGGGLGGTGGASTADAGAVPGGGASGAGAGASGQAGGAGMVVVRW